MTEKNTNVAERLKELRMTQRTEAVRRATPGIVDDLAHDDTGVGSLNELTKKIKQKRAPVESINQDYVKMTIFVRSDIAEGVYALCTRRGQIKQFVNEALANHIREKAHEMGIDC